MKEYKVKASSGTKTFMKVIREESDGYRVLIRTISEYSEKESEQYLSRHLFDACLRTGYLTEIKEPQAVTA
jgi:hypothetical protein